MNIIKELTNRIIVFRDKRDWKKFHNPKDMSLSLILEASELLEHFQWKNGIELQTYIKQNKSDISDELADILYWVLLISHDLDIDIVEAFNNKMKINELKYDENKSKGSNKKYTELSK